MVLWDPKKETTQPGMGWQAKVGIYFVSIRGKRADELAPGDWQRAAPPPGLLGGVAEHANMPCKSTGGTL